MSRAREGLIVMENLIKSAPTLPVEVLLNNEYTGKSIEDLGY
jgi:DNA helicase-2/ATP-dependent DNA helicase PcrA